MPRAAIGRLADAVRTVATASVTRHGFRGHEAEVLAVNPLRVRSADMDEDLTDADVTFGGLLAVHLAGSPLVVGDALVLVEVQPGDYDAVDVLRKNG